MSARLYTKLWTYLTIILLLSAWIVNADSDNDDDYDSSGSESSVSSAYDSSEDGHQIKMRGAVVAQRKSQIAIYFYRPHRNIYKEMLFRCVIDSQVFLKNGGRLFPFNRESAHSNYGHIRTDRYGYEVTMTKPTYRLKDCEFCLNDCALMGGKPKMDGYPCLPYDINFYAQDLKKKIGRCKIRDESQWREVIDDFRPTPFEYTGLGDLLYRPKRLGLIYSRDMLCTLAKSNCRRIGGVLAESAFCSTLESRIPRLNPDYKGAYKPM